MKQVVSVSIGSSKRDKEVCVTLLGEEILIRREGTDGDHEKAIARIRELDGTIDAFGLGGFDLYVYAAGKRYTIRDAKRVALAAQVTPILDGSGLKNTMERQAVRHMVDQLGLDLCGVPVLMTAAVDRFGMAEGLNEVGADITFGDLMFGLGVPIPIRGWGTFETVASLLLPIVVNLPYSMLYPSGEEQEKESSDTYKRYYESAQLIAGDFLYVRKYMPQDMSGKWVLTNTTTAEDVEDMRRRGVELLVTTTPRIEGRSFGTNMMEATFVALRGTSQPLAPQEYLDLADELGFTPDVRWLQRET